MTSAVVFAYHNVGYRCLSALLAHGIDIKLLITHEDDPGENVWFSSVARLAKENGIEVVTPDDPNTQPFIERIAGLSPDFIFSFYYRKMLNPELLGKARRGAFNMHGSLLPKYRGRVPVNWAIIHGETETGATLHEMLAKPDAGRIVDQMAVPILPNDTAREVFEKVTVAAELVLFRSVPGLVNGTAELHEQNLLAGSYFSGRKAEDGRISWGSTAASIHNLVRAVSHPYPGAFFDLGGKRLTVWRTHQMEKMPDIAPRTLLVHNDALIASAGDGKCLQLLQLELDGQLLSALDFQQTFGDMPLSL